MDTQTEAGRLGEMERVGGPHPTIPWLVSHHNPPDRPLKWGGLGPNFLEEKAEVLPGHGDVQLLMMWSGSLCKLEAGVETISTTGSGCTLSIFIFLI